MGMDKEKQQYYIKDLDGQFKGKLKEAMLYAYNKCDHFLNGLEEPLNFVEEKVNGFYIELSNVGELMNEWLELHKDSIKDKR